LCSPYLRSEGVKIGLSWCLAMFPYCVVYVLVIAWFLFLIGLVFINMAKATP
jgi:hypothetical protein